MFYWRCCCWLTLSLSLSLYLSLILCLSLSFCFSLLSFSSCSWRSRSCSRSFCLIFCCMSFVRALIKISFCRLLGLSATSMISLSCCFRVLGLLRRAGYLWHLSCSICFRWESGLSFVCLGYLMTSLGISEYSLCLYLLGPRGISSSRDCTAQLLTCDIWIIGQLTKRWSGIFLKQLLHVSTSWCVVLGVALWPVGHTFECNFWLDQDNYHKFPLNKNIAIATSYESGELGWALPVSKSYKIVSGPFWFVLHWRWFYLSWVSGHDRLLSSKML